MRLPTFSTSLMRSRQVIWDTTITDSLRKPDSVMSRWTLPGASANLRFVVKGTHRTVLMLLRLKLSAWNYQDRAPEAGYAPEWYPEVSPPDLTTNHLP